jgi:hypothetical protein
MTQYFVLDYQGGIAGVPVWINGVIEEYVQKPWNEFAPGAEEHYRDQTPLNLRTKQRSIDVDFCQESHILIVSDHFLERLSGFACHYVTRPLQIWAGKKLCTQKKFFMLHALDRLWAMDVEQSEYRVNRDGKTGEIRYSPWEPEQRTYRSVFRLYVDATKTMKLDLFYCHEPGRHIVSDRLARVLVGLKGVRLTPTEEYDFPLTGEKVIDRG